MKVIVMTNGNMNGKPDTLQEALKQYSKKLKDLNDKECAEKVMNKIKENTDETDALKEALKNHLKTPFKFVDDEKVNDKIPAHDNKNLNQLPENEFASNLFNGIAAMHKEKTTNVVNEPIIGDINTIGDIIWKEQFNAYKRCSDKINTFSLNKSSTLKSLKMVIDIIDSKKDQYDGDPIAVLSLDNLLNQIEIKAVRARMSKTNEKRIDELLDNAVYSILTIEKILNESG
jgi:hypothetical protein